MFVPLFSLLRCLIDVRIVNKMTTGTHSLRSMFFGLLLLDNRTWGGGMYGKLGHGNEAGSSTPKRVEALVGHCVTLIACGSRHTAVVLSTGALYSWGDQDNGVAGHGDINGGGNGNNGRVEIAANHQEGGLHQQQHQQQQQQNHNLHQYLPRLVERLAGKRVVQLSACGFHTGCLTDIGECFTWGGTFTILIQWDLFCTKVAFVLLWHVRYV